MKNDASVEYITLQYIPAKSLDVSIMHYSTLGLLKKALFKYKHSTIDAARKIEEEEWKSMPLEILRKTLLS